MAVSQIKILKLIPLFFLTFSFPDLRRRKGRVQIDAAYQEDPSTGIPTAILFRYIKIILYLNIFDKMAHCAMYIAQPQLNCIAQGDQVIGTRELY